MATGKQQSRGTVPALPAGLTKVFDPKDVPACSFSATSGMLAMLLGRVDPNSPRGIQNTEL